MLDSESRIPKKVAGRYVIAVSDAFDLAKRGTPELGRVLLVQLLEEAQHCEEPWGEQVLAFVERALVLYDAAHPLTEAD